MSQQLNYEMTVAEFTLLQQARKSGTHVAFWLQLGETYGFDYKTARRTVNGSTRQFTAESTEDSPDAPN